MMRLALDVLFFLSILSTVFAFLTKDIEEWQNFKMTYDKRYNSKKEDFRRMKIFLDKKREVEYHNQLYYNGTKTFKKMINKFSDYTPSELMKKTKKMLGGYPRQNGLQFSPPKSNLPEFVDWRSMGAVTEVKDQGECGACWAFAATGALEAQHFLLTGKIVSFSEQNLVDCSKDEGNFGCHGGWVDLAFEYVKKNNGIETEEAYPYKGEDKKCRIKIKGFSTPGLKLVDYVDLPAQEYALQYAVANFGPVTVRIDAEDSFADYASGIYYGEDCLPSEHNHAALVVGYGSSGGTDFWLVKNSWGQDWGDQGYIKMSRNKNNNCGIASLASYPLLSIQ